MPHPGFPGIGDPGRFITFLGRSAIAGAELLAITAPCAGTLAVVECRIGFAVFIASRAVLFRITLMNTLGLPTREIPKDVSARRWPGNVRAG